MSIAPKFIVFIFFLLIQGTVNSLSLEDSHSPYDGTLPKLRDKISLNQIPERLVKYFIAVEDPGFYQNNRYKVRFHGYLRDDRLISVVVFSGNILMAVAKKFHIREGISIQYLYKLKSLGERINKKNSKSKILEYYLNTVNLGNNIKGVKNAASVYYGKDLNTLTISQFAVLVGIVEAPYVYDPYRNPVVTLSRRNVVLSILYLKKLISLNEFQESIRMPLGIVPLPKK